MQTVRARVLGYCMGVRRAVEMAERLLDRVAASRIAENTAGNGGGDAAGDKKAVRGVYTIGPLIHNNAVLDDFRRRGAEILDEKNLPETLENAAVIIRAHGITPALEAGLRRRGAEIEDATCPRVKASQKKARDFHEAGYTVFIAGEKDHGEIAGLQGYAPDAVVVADRAEAEREAERLLFRFMYGGTGRNRFVLAGAAPVKTALLSQTTFSPEEFRAIAEAITTYFPHTETVDTICRATQERQESLRELCTQADAVLVIGGRGSANTRRLFSLAQNLGKRAWLIENADEIPPEIAAYHCAGISAGASTPPAAIDAVEAALAAR